MSKKVKCSDCGYLCIKQDERRYLGESHPWGSGHPGWEQYEDITNYVEITPKQRRNISELKNDLMNIFCYRHDVAFETELKRAVEAEDTDLSKFVDIINKPRQCRHHTEHVSGYEPFQHLMRWESIERERSNRRWSLLYIVIGSIITIIGALAIKLIFG
jgi:hypothetical protein